MKMYKFNPYPYEWQNSIDILSRILMHPCRTSLDQSLSCFVPTTKELKTPHIFLGTSLLTFPVYLLIYLVTLIPWIIGFMLWISVCHQRSNFRISVSDLTTLSKSYIDNNKSYMKNTNSRLKKGTFTSKPYHSSQTTFSFATLNVCFLQEVLSRYNNLGNTAKRSDAIGERLTKNQLKFRNNILEQKDGSTQNGCYISKSKLDCSNARPNAVISEDINGHNKEERQTYPVTVNSVESDIDVTVRTEFPDTDFMIFQETWEINLAERLISHLHKIYPYIVYDVGATGLRENGYGNNSALMIASKVPIIEVQYHLYSHRYLVDKLSAKGLLQIKVDLGYQNGERKIGLIHTTHMQVYPGKLPVRQYQLDEIVTWTKEFRSETKDDIIAFDVLAGDFNFDNTSPVDKRDYSHKLFYEFRDICRVKPGEDQPFVIGTDMRHTPLHDELTSTPSGLKTALDDPILRQYYIVDGNLQEEVTSKTSLELTKLDEDGNVIPHPLGGRRRLDYIMFRECDQVIPTAYNNVTLLAGLTDHVCLSMTMKIS